MNIEEVTGEIIRLHKKITVDAVKIGTLLLEVKQSKQLAGERNFKKWVEPNCGFTYVQALKYIKLSIFAQSIESDPEKVKVFYLLDLMKAYEVAGVSHSKTETEEREGNENQNDSKGDRKTSGNEQTSTKTDQGNYEDNATPPENVNVEPHGNGFRLTLDPKNFIQELMIAVADQAKFNIWISKGLLLILKAGE